MKTWVIADTHFGHNGVCQFTRSDGSKLRPWTNPQDMDAAMIAKWNEKVSIGDKVYHLGDVTFHRRHLEILSGLNGRKVLIRGNHDTLKLSQYAKYFYDIRGCHVLNRFLLSHIPVHPGSKARFYGNIHGHTHANRVMDESGNPDPWYISVCVEHTNYAPVLLDDIFKTKAAG